MREVGIDLTTRMCERLIAEGAAGPHFNTNFSRATREVLTNLSMAPAPVAGQPDYGPPQRTRRSARVRIRAARIVPMDTSRAAPMPTIIHTAKPRGWRGQEDEACNPGIEPGV